MSSPPWTYRDPGGTRVGGHGVAVVDGTLGMQGFQLELSTLCGIFPADDPVRDLPGWPSVDLSHGIVHRNEIGACVQVPYDVDRLQFRVRYFNNRSGNLQATTFPVSVPVPPVS